ncbi:hypothetical protein [Nocardiopsis coralliicola]
MNTERDQQDPRSGSAEDALGAADEETLEDGFSGSEGDRAEERPVVEEPGAWTPDQDLGKRDDVPEGDAVEQRLEVGGEDEEYR